MPVDEDKGHKLVPQKTLWMYFREGLRRANKARPMSFYLLLAIPVVLLLGTKIVEVRESPKQFAFFLALLFVFLFAVLLGAIADFIGIARRHFWEDHKLFGSTLGDAEFASKLGERVSQERKE